MQLSDLSATGDPAGHRIVLTWRAPGAVAPGARVVRRAGAFPLSATPAVTADGVVVADTDGSTSIAVEDLGGGQLRVADDGLSEAVHYYQVFPYAGAVAVYDDDAANRVAAAATAPFGFAARLAALLPAVYHRFDTLTPAAAADQAIAAAASSAHLDQGQLRRYLDLPGAELDRIYSDIRALLDLCDVRRLDGTLLPLLGAGIGWRTDFRLGYDQQRTEISHAPALYRTVGTVPAAEAVVRRISGWSARTKEYVDNIFTTGHAERRTLWLATLAGGSFALDDEPLSIDSSPHGRPVAVSTPDGSLALVYHASADGAHEIRWKQRRAGQWQPSAPVVSRGQVDRDPAVARQGTTIWVFWSVYEPTTRGWRIDLRTLGPGGGGPVVTFGRGEASPPGRRSPAAAVDHEGALWLFWLEGSGTTWRLRHARFTGTPWNPSPAAAADVPDDAGEALRPEAGLSVVARPPQAGDPAPAFRRVGVLWARRVPVLGEPGQTRWRTVVRFKNGSNPANAGDWGPVVPLPVTDQHHDDLDPAAHVRPGGAIRVLFASTRDGGWSVYASDLSLEPVAWSPTQAVTAPPFSERTPLPLSLAGSGEIDAICMRSNRSITRTSTTHSATVTVDRRWSGATTVRARDTAALALRGTFDDHLSYVYDTGRTDADRYARNTVGLFVDTGAAGAEEVALARERLRRVLPEFVPATDRAVVIDAAP